MEGPLLRAVIYVRVSTDAQEKDGTSLETQQQACIEYAEAAGWHVVECVPDVCSGSTLNRVGIERVRQGSPRCRSLGDLQRSRFWSSVFRLESIVRPTRSDVTTEAPCSGH